MTSEDERDIFRRALAVFGAESQWGMVVEETSELNAKINQHKRGRASVDQVAEEVADALLVLEQARMMVGEARVDRIRKKKLEKLLQYVVHAEQNR